MEFRLVYQGPLPAAGYSGKSTRVKEKHEIRRVLHKQLAKIWRTHPFIAKYALRQHPYYKLSLQGIELPDGNSFHPMIPAGIPVSPLDKLSARYARCGYNFIPLVGGLFGEGAETVCALDIMFLRREAPGSVVSGGDIDNRLKVLFDALRMPKICDEVKGFTPDATERPFFCLLEDDSLITEVRVTTDQLLTPLGEGEREHDVNLIIHVKTMAVGMGFADIGRPSVLDLQAQLSDTSAAHESRLSQLHNDGDAIRAAVDQDKEAIQTLIADNAALRANLAAIIAGDVKIAKANLELNGSLRNQILVLVAELREIGNRIKIVGDYPPQPTAPPGWHVSSSQLMAWVRAAQDFEFGQKWKQYWDIYRSDFEQRVKAIINDLRQANVASDALIAFPETVGLNELDHHLPMSIGDQLIPELMNAADALAEASS